MTLQLRQLSVSYQRPHRPPVHAVVGVDLEVGPGEVVGLVGESGCGKSTLARAAIGLVPRSRGEVTFLGSDVPPLGSGARATELRRMQMIFQDPYASLNPRRRVGRQIADGFDGVGKEWRPMTNAWWRCSSRWASAGRSPAATRSSSRAGSASASPSPAPSPPTRASSSPTRRCQLDASTQAQVANLLVRLARDRDAGLLFISHDLGIVRHICDRVAVMYLGTIVEQGPTDAIWSETAHPYTRALIAAVPRHDGSHVLPEALEGEVPDPARPPSGCRFHPRCSSARRAVLDRRADPPARSPATTPPPAGSPPRPRRTEISTSKIERY